MSEVTDTAALVAGLALKPTILKDSRGVEYAFTPRGQGTFDRAVLTPASEIKPAPAFIAQQVSLVTSQSLIDYVNRFKTPETMIFANAEEDAIVACIDYHEATQAPQDANSAAKAKAGSGAGLVSHKANLQLRTSNEWNTWCGVDDAMMLQGKFARFIEENKGDVWSPDGATLLEMVLDMEKGVNMRVGRKMASAGSDRGFSTADREVVGTELPPVWSLRLPVYFGEPAVGVTAFARDQIDDGKLLVGFKLSKLDNIREAEFSRIAAAIGTETGVPVVIGAIG